MRHVSLHVNMLIVIYVFVSWCMWGVETAAVVDWWGASCRPSGTAEHLLACARNRCPPLTTQCPPTPHHTLSFHKRSDRGSSQPLNVKELSFFAGVHIGCLKCQCSISRQLCVISELLFRKQSQHACSIFHRRVDQIRPDDGDLQEIQSISSSMEGRE